MNGREWACLLPLAFLVLYLGLAPSLSLKIMNPSLEELLSEFNGRKQRIAFSMDAPTIADSVSLGKWAWNTDMEEKQRP